MEKKKKKKRKKSLVVHPSEHNGTSCSMPVGVNHVVAELDHHLQKRQAKMTEKKTGAKRPSRHCTEKPEKIINEKAKAKKKPKPAFRTKTGKPQIRNLSDLPRNIGRAPRTISAESSTTLV